MGNVAINSDDRDIYFLSKCPWFLLDLDRRDAALGANQTGNNKFAVKRVADFNDHDQQVRWVIQGLCIRIFIV